MSGPRYLFCGGRTWKDRYIIQLLVAGLHTWGRMHKERIVVIEGEAPGADSIARKEAADYSNIDVLPFPADWKKHGKAAGPIRNQEMLDEGRPSIVFAFHDNLKRSKGTRDMCARAHDAGIPVYVIRRYGRLGR